ncbi:CAP domain-containing protein [Thalassobaculum salexigens]|uniref:CAP domain-containing protein n=1 Tax=Thalassobaculum salexigens TaxID=455360 RepID=UPI00248DE3C4|nr:CAP domain-containing protein [Thalassobaculum salexigens]
MTMAALPAHADARAELIGALNQDRQSRGLPALVEAPALMQAAEAHVGDMVERGYVGVHAPDGTDAGIWLQRAGVQTPVFSAVAVSNLPEHWNLAKAVLRTQSMADVLQSPGPVKIGVGFHEKMFRLADGGLTAEAWSIIVAQDTPAPVTDAVAELLRQINAARARKGIDPVRINDKLMRAAEMQAEDMAANSYIGHGSPGGPDLIDRVKAVGYDFTWAAENTAAGQGSAQLAVEAWDSSPGHAKTLYGIEFDEVGIAYRYGPIAKGALVLPHLWVAVFGRR